MLWRKNSAKTHSDEIKSTFLPFPTQNSIPIKLHIFPPGTKLLSVTKAKVELSLSTSWWRRKRRSWKILLPIAKETEALAEVNSTQAKVYFDYHKLEVRLPTSRRWNIDPMNCQSSKEMSETSLTDSVLEDFINDFSATGSKRWPEAGVSL